MSTLDNRVTISFVKGMVALQAVMLEGGITPSP
jgi:hypothetical protein